MDFKITDTSPNRLGRQTHTRLSKPQHAAMEPGLHSPSMRAPLWRLRLSQPRVGWPSGITGRGRAQHGFTLLEVMLASGVGLVVLLAVMLLSLYSSRSFVAIANYVSMDEKSQFALDKMSKELRQGHRLISFKPTSLSFLDANDQLVEFAYDADGRQLIRKTGSRTNSYLTDCDFLQFSRYQGAVRSNTFDCYEVATVTNSKLIQVTWACSHKILGARLNTESVQSAKIVIRNRVNQ